MLQDKTMAMVDPAEPTTSSDLGDRLALLPWLPVALGDREMPVERLMALQSAAANLVHLLVSLRWPKPTRVASPGWRQIAQ